MSMRLIFKKYFIALACVAFAAAACSDDDDGNNGSNNGGNNGANNGAVTDSGADGQSSPDGSNGDAGSDAEEDVYTPECPDGEAFCGDSCVDTLDSTEHCGGCGMTCPSWNATCDQGNCICEDDNFTYCDGFCVDTQLDPVNCGQCGNTCGDGSGIASVCYEATCKTRAERVTEETNTYRSTETDCGGEGAFPATTPLELDPDLTEAAQAHAEDMRDNDDLSHTGSDGSDFAERIGRTDFAGQPVGENVAGGQTTAIEVVDGWIDSDGHCANIMNADATKIGVGYAYEEDGGDDQIRDYWVQVFGN